MTLLPLLSEVCDRVITHPNVANAACFQSLPPSVFYVEGYALDQWFQGHWALHPAWQSPLRRQRVGVVWDRGIEPRMKVLHQNTINAVKTTYGVEVVGLEETASPVQLVLTRGASGRSTGQLLNPTVLMEAGQRLLDQGATALAVCCRMPDGADHEAETAYQSGAGVDPIAGLEALISHAMVAQLQCPVAHAPVFDWEKAQPVTDELVDERSASEYIVSTFLPCVLQGLSRAPSYSAVSLGGGGGVTVDQLNALLVPADALGSVPVLACVERGVPVLAIENNTTVMQATVEAMGLAAHVIRCSTYLEALGYLVAMKSGVKVPGHLVTVGSARS